MPPVSHVDIAVTVSRDGSLSVRETFRVRFDTSHTSFHRSAPAVGHDGISEVRATLDDVELPPAGEKRIESRSGSRLDVTWRFPPVTGEHTLGLTYRAANAVHVSGIRGRVSWLALPPRHGLAIDAMTISLALPGGVVQLQDPWINESGWAVTRETLGMRAAKSSVTAAESVTAGAEFTIDGLGLAQPAWQYHAQRAGEFMPAFVSAGTFLLVVAAGILMMVRVRLAALEPGVAERERAGAVRGLRVSGWVTLAAGALGWLVVAATLGTYGAWPYALPSCTIASGLLFLWDARRLSRPGGARQ